MSSELPEGFKPNPGHLPEEAKGKRVRVILRHSMAEPRYANESRADLPPGWAAEGKPPTRWTLRKDPFDIIAYKVI